MNQRKIRLGMIILLIILAVWSLFIGAYDVTLSTLIDDPKAAIVLLEARVPRLLAILCTGIGMSIGGLIMQNLLVQNMSLTEAPVQETIRCVLI